MLNNNHAEDLREIFKMTTKLPDEVNQTAIKQMKHTKNSQNQGTQSHNTHIQTSGVEKRHQMSSVVIR